MDLKELLKIKEELKRFENKIDEGIALAKLQKGHTIFGSTQLYGVNSINGTRLAGSIKRSAMELKYYLNKHI